MLTSASRHRRSCPLASRAYPRPGRQLGKANLLSADVVLFELRRLPPSTTVVRSGLSRATVRSSSVCSSLQQSSPFFSRACGIVRVPTWDYDGICLHALLWRCTTIFLRTLQCFPLSVPQCTRANPGPRRKLPARSFWFSMCFSAIVLPFSSAHFSVPL